MSPYPPAAAVAPRQPAQAAVTLAPGLLARAEALALVEQVNGALLASPSATATLARWCADHALAPDPQIHAEVDRSVVLAASAEQRHRLGVGASEPLGFRHVRLTCGGRTLSEADNWYVPSRLTPEMNAALAATDAPFGRLVAPLGVTRRTFAVERLWSPLAPGWDRHAPDASGPLAVPHLIFRHRALVLDREGRPIAEVAENYTSALIATLNSP